MRGTIVLVAACLLELAIGSALIAVPGVVVSILFSAGLTRSGVTLGRVGGCALLSLGVACWPRGGIDQTAAVQGLFLFNLMAAGYLSYLNFAGVFNSFLLMPACLLHAALALLLMK